MIQHAEIQSIRGQDMVRVGNSSHPWIVVADGHGAGKTIDTLRKLDWETIMTHQNPVETANTAISALPDTYNDGATLSTVKFTKKGIDCAWIGDSQIRVYCDDQEIWRSSTHNGDGSEVLGLQKQSTWKLSVIDKNCITMTPSYYFHRDGKEMVALTHTLGHNQAFCTIGEHHHIPFKKKSKYKVVVASDGIWDMICDGDDSFLASAEQGAQEIANLAIHRWGQEWTYKHPPPSTHSSREFISNSRDDIAIATCVKNL
jgi:serine/threonine protein phosphatase PrpC